MRSMEYSVAQIIAQIIGSKRKPDQFLLERFNDPVVQHPPFVTSDPNALLAAVNAIDPSGGGDCPELSQEGLLAAVGAAHSGSTLYFYSDASAKDAFLAPFVIVTALVKNIKINYVLTGTCSPVDLAYVAGAQKTGGQIFFLRSDETGKIANLIEPSLSGDLQPLLIVNDTLTAAGKEHLIPVDSTITAVTFSITTDTAATIKIIRPTGGEVTASDPDTTVTDISSGRIITVVTPMSGVWRLQVSGTGNFSASVMGNSSIGLDNFSFVELRGRLGHEGLFPITRQPVASEPLIALANVMGPFGTVEFELRSEAGDVLKTINLTEGGSDNAAADDFVGSFDLPRETFRVYAKGTDEDSLNFIRVFPPTFLGQTVKVTADVSTAQIKPGDTTTIRFDVTNLGVFDNFKITTMDDHGFVARVSPENITLGTNESATIEVDLTVPNSTPTGTTALLTVVAQSAANPAISNSAVMNLEVIESGFTFDAFDIKELNIKFGHHASDDRFKMRAFFKLGAGSNGNHADIEPVGIQIGTFSTTLPSGSFLADKHGRFRFKGVIDGVALEAVIRPLENGHFEFTVRGDHANLMGTVNPVKVNLAIEDDSGNTTATAKFKKEEGGKKEQQD